MNTLQATLCFPVSWGHIGNGKSQGVFPDHLTSHPFTIYQLVYHFKFKTVELELHLSLFKYGFPTSLNLMRVSKLTRTWTLSTPPRLPQTTCRGLRKPTHPPTKLGR